MLEYIPLRLPSTPFTTPPTIRLSLGLYLTLSRNRILTLPLCVEMLKPLIASKVAVFIRSGSFK